MPAAALLLHLVVGGAPEDAARIEEVARELVGRLGVEVRAARVERIDLSEVVARTAAEPGVVARAWVDATSATRATIYVADARTERVLVREVPLQAGVDEVAREEIGHILEATVEALRTGETIGRPREEVRAELGVHEEPARPPPPPPPAPAPRRTEAPPPLAARVGLVWEAQGFSSDVPVTHGPAAWLSVAARREGPAPVASLLAAWRLPIEFEESGAGGRLHGAALRLLGGLRLPWREDVSVHPALGGGVDLLRLTPSAHEGSGVRPTRTRWTAVPFLRGAVGLELAFFGSTTLLAVLALDLDPTDSRYSVGRPGDRDVVLDPWTLRPSLALGVGSR